VSNGIILETLRWNFGPICLVENRSTITIQKVLYFRYIDYFCWCLLIMDLVQLIVQKYFVTHNFQYFLRRKFSFQIKKITMIYNLVLTKLFMPFYQRFKKLNIRTRYENMQIHEIIICVLNVFEQKELIRFLHFNYGFVYHMIYKFTVRVHSFVWE